MLAASAVAGTPPPAGPEWRRGALSFERRSMVFERPLCAALDGFTLHAATRAGGHDVAGREALLKYVLRRHLSNRPTRSKRGGRESARRADELEETFLSICKVRSARVRCPTPRRA